MAIPEGYYKVNESGGTFVVATFFNPTTMDGFSKCVRDYDYSDCSRDDDDAYYMPISKEVQRIWLHHHGEILVDDKAKVVKGRKVPIGTIATVIAKKPVVDKYGRQVATYLYFDNGMRTNETNCVLEEAN